MNLRPVVFTLFALTLIVQFQNCSQVRFSSELPIESLLKSNSNGTNYGGKPTGTHYRFNPDFTCENKPSPVASVEIQPANFVYTENKKLVCGNSTTSIPLDQLDTSIYQTEIVGYQEGIYEGKSELPNAIPANLVEVWCRDRKDEQGIETISYYDRVKKEAVTRAYYSVLNGSGHYQAFIIPDFPTDRLISGSQIRLVAGIGFELNVDRNQPATQPGLFNGSLKLSIAGQMQSREMQCRLGGSLDPNIWPLPVFTDFNVVDLIMAPNQKMVAFSTTSGTNMKDLYVIDSITGVPRSVAAQVEDVPLKTYNKFGFSPDSSSIFFNRLQSLNSFSLVTNSLTVIDNTNAGAMQNIMGDFQFSKEGQYVLFRQITPGSSRNQVQLKSLHLATGVVRVLNPIDPSSSVSNTFLIAKELGKAIFAFGQTENQRLYITNFDGTQLQDITPNLAPAVANILTISMPEGSTAQYVYVNMKVVQGATSNTVGYLVWLNGGVPLQAGPMSVIVSDKTQPLIAVSAEAPTYKNSLAIYNATTGAKVVLSGISTLSDPYYINYSKSIAFIGGNMISAPSVNTDGKQFASVFDFVTGTLTDICPGLVADQIFIKKNDVAGFMIVAALDRAASRLSLYRASLDLSGGCTKLNSVPVTSFKQSYIDNITFSNDQNKVAVNLGISRYTNEGYGQLFYVPLNGLPSYRVNSPAFVGAQVNNFFFTDDSKSIVFHGPQIQSGKINLFKWLLPF